MKKILVATGLAFIFSFVCGQQVVRPATMMKASGAVTDFYLDRNNLVVILTTDNGTIETFDLKSGKKIRQIRLPEMKDFMGDPIPSKAYSIDQLNNRLLVVTQGNHGFRNVLMYEGSNQKKLIDAGRDKMLVKKARFIDSRRVLLGMLSNEIMLYDSENNKVVYNLPVSAYTFSDFCLSEDRKHVFTADESGIVHKIDVLAGKITEEYTSCNVDNVYKLQFRNGTIITAGQDRRVGVYRTVTGSHYYLQKNFLVYCVGLNPDGTTGAFTADEENAITLFDIATKRELYKLNGHRSVVTRIEFVDDKTVISGAEDDYLILWKIK